MTGPALSREIVAMIADRADWLVDAVACSTQNRMFLRGEKECDAEACGSILLNGKQAITQVAQAQAAELERLRAALTGCISALEHADLSDGVCCCGDDMKNHLGPMDCGHSPVDAGEYYSMGIIKQAREALKGGTQ